jgi:prepilin-type N-terminal cleavage/methylation domain-containing protein
MTHRSAFTLIELLVVIAILAVLAVVVILTLNPAQMLAQARDSNRFSDMVSLQTAMNLYISDQPGASIGSSSVTYVSIPDPTATTTAGDHCEGLGLPGPSQNYHCAATSTFRNNDSTGWMPVNFKSISSGAPISQLPIDPVNASTSGLFYLYAANSNNQYDLATGMEASKNKGISGTLGTQQGRSWNSYEIGTSQGLIPLGLLEYKKDSSLIGLWSFNEGTGTTVYDYSGSGNNGTWNGTLGNQYVAGKIGSYAGNFDGSTNYVNVPGLGATLTAQTILAWVKLTKSQNDIAYGNFGQGFGLAVYTNAHPEGEATADGSNRSKSNDQLSVNGTTWQLESMTYANGTTLELYINGTIASGYILHYTAGSAITAFSGMKIGGPGNMEGYTGGAINELRIYNRVLSAAEMQWLYNNEH